MVIIIYKMNMMSINNFVRSYSTKKIAKKYDPKNSKSNKHISYREYRDRKVTTESSGGGFPMF